jgi:hypothetical protein
MKISLALLGILVIAMSIGAADAQGRKNSRDVAPAIYAPDDPAPAITAPVSPAPATATAPATAPMPQELQQTQAMPPPTQHAAEDDVQVPFDFQSFCTSPASDGSPRSPVWTESCLAGAGASGTQPGQAPAR